MPTSRSPFGWTPCSDSSPTAGLVVMPARVARPRLRVRARSLGAVDEPGPIHPTGEMHWPERAEGGE